MKFAQTVNADGSVQYKPLNDCSMSKRAVIWASQHDWFCSDYISKQGMRIVVVYDSCTDSLVEFDNLADLRNWAGY